MENSSLEKRQNEEEYFLTKAIKENSSEEQKKETQFKNYLIETAFKALNWTKEIDAPTSINFKNLEKEPKNHPLEVLRIKSIPKNSSLSPLHHRPRYKSRNTSFKRISNLIISERNSRCHIFNKTKFVLIASTEETVCSKTNLMRERNESKNKRINVNKKRESEIQLYSRKRLWGENNLNHKPKHILQVIKPQISIETSRIASFGEKSERYSYIACLKNKNTLDLYRNEAEKKEILYQNKVEQFHFNTLKKECKLKNKIKNTPNTDFEYLQIKENKEKNKIKNNINANKEIHNTN